MLHILGFPLDQQMLMLVLCSLRFRSGECRYSPLPCLWAIRTLGPWFNLRESKVPQARLRHLVRL